MVSIAVVEDDPQFVQDIENYLKRFEIESGESFTIKHFSDGYAIVDGYRANYDIILMDIEMGLMNGMEAAREIRKSDDEVTIIFITSMARYAIQGYSVRALDYVLKPVSYTAFAETLKKAISGVRRKTERYITVNYKDGIVKLKAADISWIESRGHRLTFHTQSGEYETTVYSMKEMEGKLAGDAFLRASSGTLVNLRRVTGAKNGCVEVDGQQIPISRGRKAEFMSALVSSMVE